VNKLVQGGRLCSGSNSAERHVIPCC
jgi:hypothetical protein